MRLQTLPGRAALGAAPVSEFPDSVLRWLPLLRKHAGTVPIPFLLAYIKKESNGNPCTYTTLRESGIFQLMWPHNLREGITSEEALRAACVGTSQRPVRPLTEAEAEEQVASGLRYINFTRAYARRYVDWPETSADFWRMVKMVHVAPARVKQYGPGSKDWAEFRRRAEAGGDTPKRWLDNAEWVGSYGAGGGGEGGGGGGGSLFATLAIVGILTLGSMAYFKRRSR